MKKIIIYSLILLVLLSRYGLNLSYNVIADSVTIETPQKVNLIEEDTTFDIKLNKVLDNNQRIQIIITGSNYLSCGDGEEDIELDVSLSNQYLSNDNPKVTVSISHCDLPFGNWKGHLKIGFKLIGSTKTIQKNTNDKQVGSVDEKPIEKVSQTTITKEQKTVYTYRTVASWNEDNYSLEKPSGDFEERTQYSSLQAQFEDSSFSSAIPEDGYFRELTQYGYNQRSKNAVSTPHTTYSHVTYNNVGKCPADCISGTINDYGSGCECTISVPSTSYTTSYSYGSWNENSSSWRSSGPYDSSDTVQPITRTVYLVPVSWTEPSVWTYENPGDSAESKVITRTVYVTPASYSNESPYQDSKPSGDHIIITEHKLCRIITNGEAGQWYECE